MNGLLIAVLVSSIEFNKDFTQKHMYEVQQYCYNTLYLGHVK